MLSNCQLTNLDIHNCNIWVYLNTETFKKSKLKYLKINEDRFSTKTAHKKLEDFVPYLIHSKYLEKIIFQLFSDFIKDKNEFEKIALNLIENNKNLKELTIYMNNFQIGNSLFSNLNSILKEREVKQINES